MVLAQAGFINVDDLQGEYFLARAWPERNAVGAGRPLQGRQGGLRCPPDGQAELTVSAAEMVIMPANRPYALKALKRFNVLLVMIRS